MNADEIRAQLENRREALKVVAEKARKAGSFGVVPPEALIQPYEPLLTEIAAQLAELNQNIHRATDPHFKIAMSPQRIMWEVGIVNEKFHPHLETSACANAGCVPEE